MKIADLIKQLNALKKLHGNIPAYLINGDTGRAEDVGSVRTRFPLGAGDSYDLTKPANGVFIVSW